MLTFTYEGQVLGEFFRVDLSKDIPFRFILKYGVDKIPLDFLGLFIILCQSGKIKNTKGHRDEDRNRCRTIC